MVPSRETLIHHVLISLWLLFIVIHGQDTTAPPTSAPSLSNAPTTSTALEPCTDDVTCNGQGTCVSNSFRSFISCECNDGWITHPLPKEADKSYCNYAQKQQLTAFLLHFFLGTLGAGRFYIGDYVRGGLQLGVTVLVFGSCCISLCLSKEKPSVIITGFVCIGLCTILVWWATDCVIFGLNLPTDNNGVALKPW